MAIATDAVPASQGEWECMKCGHIIAGPSNRRPASCPNCRATAADFDYFEFGDDIDDDEYDDDDFDDEYDDYDDEYDDDDDDDD